MNIIHAEFYKLKKSTPFWVCLLVCGLLAAFIPFALQQAVLSGEADVQDLSLSAAECLCYSFMLPALTVTAGIFTSIFVSGEFHHGTMKNYASKGFPRQRVFLVKFLTCAAAVTAMMAVYVVMALISGTVFLGFDPHGVFSMTGLLQMLAVLWLLVMAYTAVFVTAGMSLRSNGAAIAVNICLVTLVPTLLSAVDFLLGRFGIKVSSLWIESNISAAASFSPASGVLTAGVGVGAAWLLAATVLGIWQFRRQDIK